MPPKKNTTTARKEEEEPMAVDEVQEETKKTPEEAKEPEETIAEPETDAAEATSTEDEKMDETEAEAGAATSSDQKASDDAPEEKEEPKKKAGRPTRKAAQPKKPEPKPAAEAKEATGRGRKRKTSETSAPPTPSKKSAPPTPKKGKAKAFSLSWEDFVDNKTIGDRVLSCGDGEQLGHPGRTTSKKPRKVDIVEEDEMKIVQVVAGGVHSLFLTNDHRVFSCGINEKGTVPAEGVEPEGSTDEFTEIKLANHIPNLVEEHGNVVMLTAGASFSAAMTDKGSVIAWGNLRDQSGEIDVHPLLHEMQLKPVVIIPNKKRVIVKIVAGENHLAMLSADGHLLTFGDGTMGQLGRTRRAGSIRSKFMVDESGEQLVVKVVNKKFKEVLFKNIFAGGYWTAAISTTNADAVYTFGLNNFGQLGTPFDETLKEEDEKKDSGDVAPKEDERDFRVYRPTEADAYGKRPYTHLAGVQHIVARTTEGEVFAIGKNTDNALGLGTWTGNDDVEHWRYTSLQSVDKLPSGKMAGVAATLGASIAWGQDGDAWGWGCDTSGQLGLGIKDDDEKMVSVPTPISSAHLDGYRIIAVSVADNHSLFLAAKKDE